MFTSVYPKFHNICPRIEVEPIERSVRDQHPLLLSGELDLGFMTLTRSQQKSGIIYETLASEEMVLAVPTKLVTALDMKNGDPLCSEKSLCPHTENLYHPGDR